MKDALVPIGSRSTLLRRRLQIADIIRRKGFVRVENLVEQIGVSAVTIRADLTYLEEQGFIVRANGGARHIKLLNATPQIARSPLDPMARRAMAMATAKLAAPDMSVLLGHGKLPALLPPYLPASPYLRLIITSLDALTSARQYCIGPIHLLGGQCQVERSEIDGPGAIQALTAHHIDLFVMEAIGIDASGLILSKAFSLPLHRHAARIAKKSVAVLVPDETEEREILNSAELMRDLDYVVAPMNLNSTFSQALGTHGFVHTAECGASRLYHQHQMTRKNCINALSI